MALPDIILNSPNILVSMSESPSGIESLQPDYGFGFVEMIYETSDRTVVGDYFFFKPSEAKQIKYGSTIYFLVDERNSLFKEPPVEALP